MNRNHFFLVGLVLLYVGLQFRFVETFVLNNKTSTFLAQRFGSAEANAGLNITQAAQRVFPFSSATGSATRGVTPPEWVGWALLSIGSVLVLHALAMPKPGQK
jgi:hypothetical protein